MNLAKVSLSSLCSIFLAFGLACGGGGGSTPPPPPTPDFVLQAVSSSLSLVAGGTASLGVAAIRAGGHSDPIALTLDTPPAGITGSGTIASGAATGQLALAASASAGQQTYTLQVRGTAGSLVHTCSFTLTVTAPPVPLAISQSPLPALVNLGQTATFTVTATGPAGLSYRWQRSSDAGASWTDLSAPAGASYTTPPTTALDSGILFRAQVSAGTGSATSAGAVLVVLDGTPVITAQPQNQIVQVGDTANFSVAAAGSVSCQWRLNGTAIPGATLATLTTPALLASDDGNEYSALLANSQGQVSSRGATVSVVTAPLPPRISQQPAAVTALAGQTVSFTVKAAGSAPLTYRWRKEGLDLASAPSAATLTLPAITGAQAGRYTVVVNNAAGSATSDPAALELSLGSASIGSAGGTLVAGDLQLTVPAGSFSTSQTIQATLGGRDSDALAVSDRFTLSGLPAGYSKPLDLKLKPSGTVSGSTYLVLEADAMPGSAASGAKSRTYAAAQSSGGSLVASVPVPAATDLPYTTDALAATVALDSSGSSSLSLSMLTGWANGSSPKGYAQVYYTPGLASKYPNTDYDVKAGMDAAYDRMKGMGFVFGTEGDWPITTSIRKDIVDEGVTSLSCTYNYVVDIREDQLATTDQIRTVCGHEAFHVIQNLYDPRSRWDKGHNPDPWYWLKEASSTWIEENYAQVPGTYVPVPFKNNIGLTLGGLVTGADQASLGYAMSSLIKHLVKRPEYGEALLLNLWNGVKKAKTPYSPLKQLLAATDGVGAWWPGYVNALLGSSIYKLDTTDIANLLAPNTRRKHDLFPAYDYTVSGSFQPFSAGIFQFDTGSLTDIEANQDYLISAEDPDVTVSLYSLSPTRDRISALFYTQAAANLAWLPRSTVKDLKSTRSPLLVVLSVGNFGGDPWNQSRNATLHIRRQIATALAPLNAFVGDTVTLSGSGFGRLQGASRLNFLAYHKPDLTVEKTLVDTITDWNDTWIRFTVPNGVPASSVLLELRDAAGNLYNSQTRGLFIQIKGKLSDLKPAFGAATVTATVVNGSKPPYTYAWSVSSGDGKASISSGQGSATVTVTGIGTDYALTCLLSDSYGSPGVVAASWP
jgi:hypothetical protein